LKPRDIARTRVLSGKDLKLNKWNNTVDMTRKPGVTKLSTQLFAWNIRLEPIDIAGTHLWKSLGTTGNTVISLEHFGAQAEKSVSEQIDKA
jgi:hypothetical protein